MKYFIYRFDTNFESLDMKLAAILEPKFKWNWAEVETVNELKDCLKAKLSEQLIVQNHDHILNYDTNEITYYDDFLHFDAIENPETDKLQNVFNDYSNSSPKLPLTVYSEEIQKLYIQLIQVFPLVITSRDFLVQGLCLMITSR